MKNALWIGAVAAVSALAAQAHANVVAPGGTVKPDILPLMGVTVTSTSGTFTSLGAK